MNKSNDCNCYECKPKTLKDKAIYLIPLSIVLIGIATLSLITIISGMIINYFINQNKNLKEKLENSECWY